MNRINFLKTLLGAGLAPAAALASPATQDLVSEAQRIRLDLLDAWAMSEKMTLLTAGQMPADSFEFKYTAEAMTFAEQWRHCCQFTVSQLAGRLGVADPYRTRQLLPVMTKMQVMDELRTMYAFVKQTIREVPDDTLLRRDDFMGSQLPNWRLIYAMENHIIHHRGQCMVYLRLKGITPEGYLGW
ncbi:DinB family protein [Spirosoma humi]